MLVSSGPESRATRVSAATRSRFPDDRQATGPRAHPTHGAAGRRRGAVLSTLTVTEPAVDGRRAAVSSGSRAKASDFFRRAVPNPASPPVPRKLPLLTTTRGAV